jgi:glycerol-3-phosphate dehydrogenase
VLGGDIADKERFVAGVQRECAPLLGEDAARRLALTYGRAYAPVAALARADAELARPLSAGCGVTAAEIVHAFREEAALRLSDALIRRTEAGSAGHPGPEAVASAAALARRECGWDDRRTREEIEAIERFYRLDAL